jgi:alkanesulfonate monooxygenase SsuD/methylene tetrahydromethanopterin reductase-like flavin-dependent oxidoreductase (luciferase family)
VNVRVALTLPSFVDDPAIPIAIARAADDAGLDGVFVYDHVWRGDPPSRRPAIECVALLGAVAAATTRVAVGTLVARATLRPAATLAHAFATVQRISRGRCIAGIGSGDSQSRAENEALGLSFGTMTDRIDALHAAVRATRHAAVPVWVGGRVAQIREIVAIADGWNDWGSDPGRFAREAALVREVAPAATLTWGGLARPCEEGAGPLADRLWPYAERGASWLIVGPVDASNVANVEVLAAVRSLVAQ